ncbi:MAG TPA: 3-hydroxyacyl-ACP dehydratase FabZ [Bacilli bacterium]|nr:3-hydroxyacyl-ACP dehydratase FabZ [Bacilli bacterium]
MVYNSDQIQKILPHRYPMLLVDRIETLNEGKSAIGIKCVSSNEPFFSGHFPELHVMPGVLIIEALAQVGAVVVLSIKENQGKVAYFAGIKSAKFRKKVIPGDVLVLETTITRMKGPMGMGQAIARVNGEIACEAELTFMIG